jgi:hypothetical protein
MDTEDEDDDDGVGNQLDRIMAQKAAASKESLVDDGSDTSGDALEIKWKKAKQDHSLIASSQGFSQDLSQVQQPVQEEQYVHRQPVQEQYIHRQPVLAEY